MNAEKAREISQENKDGYLNLVLREIKSKAELGLTFFTWPDISKKPEIVDQLIELGYKVTGSCISW